jgi:putative transposase
VLAKDHQRYGYRRMKTILRREGFVVNHKRIQRLCRDEGLRVLRSPKKRSRVGISALPSIRLRAAFPNHVWALDYQFDQTRDAKVLKILNVTDEFTKEALAIVVRRSIDADATVEVLEEIVRKRGSSPRFIRMEMLAIPSDISRSLRD